MINFYLGLDLGQVNDFTAIAIVEKVKEPTGEQHVWYSGNGARRRHEEEVTEERFHLRYLERLPLGAPYPEQVRHVKALLAKPELAKKTQCIVDATGGGRPVVDMLREVKVKPLAAVTITGGDTVSRVETGRYFEPEYRVPKRDLVSTIQVLLQNDRLKIAEGLPLAQILVRELQNFRVKISIATGHDSYEAWREGDHDDLVLAVAMACWYAKTQYQPRSGFYSV